MTVHEMLIEVANKIGWPEAYRNDLLVHDKEALSQYPWEHFLWLVRRTGTDLYLMSGNEVFTGADKRGWPFKMRAQAMMLSRLHEHRLFWFYTGELREITLEEAKEVFLGNEQRVLLWLRIKDRSQLLTL